MDPVKRILGKDVGAKEEDIIGWTKTGAVVSLESVNMHRDNALFVYGKPGSMGKLISEATAKKSVVEFTPYGKQYLFRQGRYRFIP